MKMDIRDFFKYIQGERRRRREAKDFANRVEDNIAEHPSTPMPDVIPPRDIDERWHGDRVGLTRNRDGSWVSRMDTSQMSAAQHDWMYQHGYQGAHTHTHPTANNPMGAVDRGGVYNPFLPVGTYGDTMNSSTEGYMDPHDYDDPATEKPVDNALTYRIIRSMMSDLTIHMNTKALDMSKNVNVESGIRSFGNEIRDMIEDEIVEYLQQHRKEIEITEQGAFNERK